MRLSCDVEIGNRILPTFNMSKKGKFIHAQLSIGRKPGADAKEGKVFLLICTTKDLSGTKYKLRDNVEQIFGRFVAEGKATIRIKEPAHDIILKKADSIQLKSFLNLIKLGSQDKNLDNITLSSLAPASLKSVEKPKSRMTILSKKDYPLTSNFPSSLTYLAIQQCTLKKFDSRILNLKQLVVLDLSDNNIVMLPSNMNSMTCLAELRLRNNQISEVPLGFCQGNLRNTLCVLDISKNKLKNLKPSFCSLTSLIQLKLDENYLTCLPEGIEKLINLRTLSGTKNHIKTLPPGFSRLHLDQLDLFNNPFLEGGPSTIVNRLEDPTLMEIAAKRIIQDRIAYTEEDLPHHLMAYLSTVCYCMCGSPCFQSRVQFLSNLDLHSVAKTVISLNTNGRTSAAVQSFLCSKKCLNKYMANPNGFWK
ncbi:unnamed protein product [Owenia fusiformis]|uniref:PIF1/LRR1 pleckstrin homology domain-containing protein n=1 Tax=Owenia fusiformis TaxID=6347 RepID=A0A8J1U4V1_OWEFU|nr:unnamed protein product [Owenia fusiformis]